MKSRTCTIKLTNNKIPTKKEREKNHHIKPHKLQTAKMRQKAHENWFVANNVSSREKGSKWIDPGIKRVNCRHIYIYIYAFHHNSVRSRITKHREREKESTFRSVEEQRKLFCSKSARYHPYQEVLKHTN